MIVHDCGRGMGGERISSIMIGIIVMIDCLRAESIYFDYCSVEYGRERARAHVQEREGGREGRKERESEID